MNYWLLTTEYPPFHGGGISTYCYHTACMLVEQNIKITIFVPDDNVTDFKITNTPEGNRIIHFNTNRTNSAEYFGYTARLSYEFASIVLLLIQQEGKPDIIEAQDYLGIGYYLLQYKHLLYEEVKDIPVVITLHSPAFLYLEYNRVPTYRFPDFQTCQMEKEAIKMADWLFAPTQFIIDAIQPYVDLTTSNKVVIRNPYIIPDHKPVNSIERNKIVYYGKLSPQKGSFELLAYFKSLWDGGFIHPLHIFGGTDIVFHPEQLTMGQLANKRYENYISKGLLQLHGKIEPAAIEKELHSAHVIVVPSIVDNLPYVVIECMGLGKVVLASVQGGQREMINHGVNGFLFDHTITGDFEEKLQYILSLPDAKIAAIGNAAKEKVAEMYHPTVITAQKLPLLETLIQKKHNSITFPFVYQKEHTPITAGGNLLSVVIPFYNMGRYIMECIQAVKAATYPEIEILIINDGSTEEDSLAVLKQAAQIAGVTIYHKPNEGLAYTRNYGALKATGEWLAFLDADDTVTPDYYEKALRVLKQYRNVFFVGSFVQYFEDTNRKWATYTPQPPYALVHNPVNSSGLVYKKAAFLAAGQNDKTVDYGLEDDESVVHLLSKGYNGVVLPEFLFQYRVRGDSMIRKLTREKLLYSYKYIAEKHSAYYADFATQVNNLLNANGPGFLFDNPTFAVTVTTNAESNSWLFRKAKAIIKKNKTLKKIALRLKK
ncbi:MAG: glycosyltransferase [Niastella sp.]|uniref:glycosyltransferase n=1 Tax=Niastella sp. TaxID=1869183 RepID=UPI00389B2AAD